MSTPVQLETEKHNTNAFDDWKLSLANHFDATQPSPTAPIGAWTGPYNGGSHRRLLSIVNDMRNKRTSYIHAAPIIQSSGSGKSRMVRELANLVFTIPFNLRDDAEDPMPDMAYPPPDSDVRTYLCQKADSSGAGQARIFSFLSALFNRMSKEVDAMFDGQQLDTVDLAQAWSRHLDKNRTKLYSEVLTECKNVTEPEHHKTGIHFAYMHLKTLQQSIARVAQNAHPQEVRIVLSFDEAHELTKATVKRSSEEDSTIYDVLCECLHDFSDNPIFTLFLSTDPSIDRLEPPRPYYSSARTYRRPVTLQVPVTETPFDCCPAFPIAPEKLTLADVRTLEFMAMFGRPLFWAHLRAGEAISGIIDVARAKLLNSRDFAVKYDAAEPIALNAVVDTLLMLDYARSPSGAARQAALVEKHLRMLFSVPAHRNYMETGYPSEPLLAEAAARQMAEYIRLSPGEDVMARSLRELYISRIVRREVRPQGELVMRLLLMKAYLRAVETDHAKTPIHELNFSGGCSLVTFIRKLFPERYADTILNSLPDNVPGGVTFAKAFENSVVRFTHFAMAEDESVISTSMMVVAFLRGMAMVICEKHAIANIVIPVLLDRQDHLKPSTMTGLLVRVNLSTRKAAIGPKIDHEDLGFFSDRAGREDGQPYIALVANFDVRPAPSSESRSAATTATPAPAQNQSTLKEVKPEPQPTSLQEEKSPAQVSPPSAFEPTAQVNPGFGAANNHPRYSIAVFGCSDSVYSVVSAADRSLYSFLLEDRGFLDDHPYQDEENLSMLQKMKPFWVAGPDCYGWINEPFLNKVQGQEDMEERVVAGPGTWDSNDEAGLIEEESMEL
ncbi:hypothetical protein BJ138DRAFT_1100885 [Hygrophoropsis aurantiaca]|uniref:Uncharacterized protein n=1 Tax=Hygrophoropsis aurantiaca TaxID=72124 RepID=A0ACB8AEQ8_9AGAM|nr:hypothetical protein BJ138DRAFT_1100885 [Hygrophoropsis aurantiaca]